MTVDVLVPAPVYRIDGVGPYSLGHGYSDASNVVAWVRQDGVDLPLKNGTDFTVSPDGPSSSGSVTLSATVASLYSTDDLVLRRSTTAEQGWTAGNAREEALARQLDRSIRVSQDLREMLDRALLVAPGLSASSPAQPSPGRLLSWDENGKLINGPLLEDVINLQDPDGIASGSLQLVNPYMFGAVGDGVVSDLNAVDDALQSGKSMFVYNGEYRISSDVGAGLAVSASTTIGGESDGAVFSINAADTGTTRLFSLADDLRIRDVSFEITASASTATAQIISMGDGLRVQGVKIDGGVTDDGGAQSHVAQAIEMNTSAASDVSIIGNLFRRLSRAILRSNSNTFTHKNIRVAFNHITEMMHTAFAWNNPEGVLRNIVMVGNTSEENAGRDLGNSTHLFGGANIQNATVVANTHHGKGGALFHAEEGTRRFAVVGNAGYFSDSAAGVEFFDNDEGGVIKTVELGAVVGNAFERETRGDATAIDLTHDMSGVGPLTGGVIVGNASLNWGRGVRTSQLAPENILSLNLFKDMDEGVQMNKASLAVSDNVFMNTTNLFDVQSCGGMVGSFRYVAATGWTGATPMIGDIVDGAASGRTIWISGFSAEGENVTIPSSNTDFLICPLGKRFIGGVRLSVCNPSDLNRFVTADIDFDPADGIVNVTNIQSYGSGVTFVDFRVVTSGSTDYLAARLSAGSGPLTANFQFELMSGGLYLL